jgi:predicted ATPase
MQLKIYSVLIFVLLPLFIFPVPTKIVLTGGPGVGKTTLIKELENRGFNVVSEVATIIIEQAIKQGLSHPAHDLESLKIFIKDICAMQKVKEQELHDNKL